jgi:hypothetical protein
MSVDNDREEEDLDETGDEPEETRPAAHQRKPRIGKRGAGAPDPKKFYRQSGGAGTGEAEQVWNEITTWMAGVGMTAHDVSISIKRVSPPGPHGPIAVGRIGGESVAGGAGITPGQALTDHVMRWCHIGTGAVGQASYDIYFGRKADGQAITTSSIAMPDAVTCTNILNAQERADAGAVGAARPPMPQPQQAPPWQPPPPPQWGPGYGYQPPVAPAPQGMDQDGMRELAFLRGAYQEALTAAREGRQPNIAPPPGAAGPVINEEAIAQRVTASVLMALQNSGALSKPDAVAAPPPPVQAAPIPAPTPAGLSGMVEKMLGGILENAFKAAGAQVDRSIKQSMGMGAPPQQSAAEEPEEEAPEVVPPKDPADDLPWTVAEVPGAKWSDGRPMIFAKNKETEDFDPMGVLMSNPVIAERAMGIAEGLGNAIKDAVTKFTQGPPAPGVAQVVREIPRTAVNAGVGYTPPPPPPPPSNGSTGGGWEAP